MKNTASKISADTVYVFTKSGNKVKTIGPAAPYLGQPCWTVERVDGASKGKGMAVPESALMTEDEWGELCT